MRSAAVHTYAKDRPGPVVRTVEEAVKSVVSPVYAKFHLLPDELLRHVHREPDRSVALPHGAQTASQSTASNISRTVCTKCEPTAKVLYERYEAKVAASWQRLNRVSLFSRVVEKYNEAVVTAAEKVCSVSACLHVVPMERIAKVLVRNKNDRVALDFLFLV